MFASLKSKIKEETGSDLSRLTSSWRAGNLLSKITSRDDSSSNTASSSGGHGDSTSESISPQLESYILDRTGGGLVDQNTLHLQYTAQLEAKLKEKDTIWEKKFEELKLSLASTQGEEAVLAQTVARTAQAEAAKAITERDAALKQLTELKDRLAAAENAHEKLDALTEELEQSRREWTREKAQLSAAVTAAESRANELEDQLAVIRAALPPDHEHHHMNNDDKRSLSPSGCEDFDRVCRERAVLSRQLQEAKVALADVKTSWSGQIASLETQVARLSRQAGEEGAERRRVEGEKKEVTDKLVDLTLELEKTKQGLANSEAKVVRLNGEVHSLAMEVKSLRSSADHTGEKAMELEKSLEEAQERNKELESIIDNERTLVKILQEKVEKANRLYDEQRAQVNKLNTVVADLQKECRSWQRSYEKERRDKDEALLRNAQISQTLDMAQGDVRYHQEEVNELRQRITHLEKLIAQHKENQAACMLIKEGEDERKREIEELKGRIESLNENETALNNKIQDLETQICDKNKKMKTLDNRISDMKKTLQRELQSSKSEMSTAEEQDISRRYLKHVVLRFLTARELEARQLTRALSVLLRLSAHEEALLRAALPPSRSGISAWLPSLTNT